ncbi:hypothetical protein SAMN05421823_105298 [Catalinimonas alkaloidigena]|uniref:Magnesium citrate secondary transporter n=1 Tax=Catalinimonas alkaloidigena TaxID=1075417 RepID=A0A1G9JF31_9BACT|nr:hypothetical protein [Catalinimonas alkaloidigena]SDL36189.1 hypothetical protein SAMN05421823_105298 [Catalinimonas alkaloidigena]
MKLTPLVHPLFLAAAALFGLHQFLQKGLRLAIPLLDNYLDDLLCLPVVLSLALVALREGVVRQPTYTLSTRQVVFATAYFALAFEVVIPHFHAGYTADLLDVVMYALGAWGFLRWLNRPAVTQPS